MKVLQIIREQETEMGEPEEEVTPTGATARAQTLTDMYMSLGANDTERNSVLEKVFVYYNRDVLRNMNANTRRSFLNRLHQKFGKNSPYTTIDRYKMNASQVGEISFPRPSNNWQIISRHFRTIARRVDDASIPPAEPAETMDVNEIVARLKSQIFVAFGFLQEGPLIGLITNNIDSAEKWEQVKAGWRRETAPDQPDLIEALKRSLKAEGDIRQVQDHLDSIGVQDQLIEPAAVPPEGILPSDDFDANETVENKDRARELFQAWTEKLMEIDEGRLYNFMLLANPDTGVKSAQRQALEYTVNEAIPAELPMTAGEVVQYFERLVTIYRNKYEEQKDDIPTR